MAIQEKVGGMWREMDRGLRIAAYAAMALATMAILWAIYAVMRDEYGTLFTQLSENDAAAIVESLKRQKTPFKLADGGTTITVPADRVYETRLALMSGNVPLSGGVGFEIFDKQGLGATEQSQRVSFQRALQGELARTISTLENVKQVRVHLVLPESSLFKRDKQEATAAVTLTLKPGTSLDSQRIVGVQRLVAASVAGLEPGRVIVTDQRGVTLSAVDAGGTGASSIEARLELQREVENHIAEKLSRMLDNAYGAGQAIISVTVALNFDSVKTTTHDVLPMRGGGGEAGVVRKRQVTNAANPDANAAGDAAASSRRANSTLEVEYEYGRRVEEVIAAPGAVRRITVGVIVPARIAEDQQKRINEFVHVAAGIDESRGDLVSVQSLASSETSRTSNPSDGGITEPEDAASLSHDAAGSSKHLQPTLPSKWTMGGIALAILVIGAVLGSSLRRRNTRPLSEAERAELLQEIRRTLGDDNRIGGI